MPADENSKRKRIHIITWEDPQLSAKPGMDLSGFEYLCNLKDGRIAPPPVASLVGYKIVDVKEGLAVFELEPAEYHYNPFSSVHGGLITTLLDTSMTAAVMTTLSRGQSCSTLEIRTQFIRPITDATGVIRSQGRLIHNGHRIAVTEGTVSNSQGKKYAHATSTFIINKLGLAT